MAGAGTPVTYAAVGATMIGFALDAAAATLARQGEVELPSRVRYATPHPALPLLYAACGNGGAAPGEQPYHLCAIARDAAGELALAAPPTPLPARPIHATVDPAGRHVLVAYSSAPGLTVHPLAPDGAIGAVLPQAPGFDFGVATHSVRVLPGGERAILVARGMKGFGTPGYVEGALKLVRYDRGRVETVASIAPPDPAALGGFNPRNVDFHPGKPLLYVSIEGQHRLVVFRLRGVEIEPEPLFVADTLADRGALRERQDCGTVHLHPDGRAAYVANRNDGYVGGHVGASWLTPDPVPIFPGGENSIAVFALDPDSGAPRPVQHADSGGLHPRTFTLDAAGQVLVVGNYAPTRVETATEVREVPAGLVLFRISSDGSLARAGACPLDTGGEKLWWSGVVG